MVKTLYLVRHGQGYHNVSETQPQVPHHPAFIPLPLVARGIMLPHNILLKIGHSSTWVHVHS
jgi:hypothetical protein